MHDSFELFERLHALDLFDRKAHPYWWPDEKGFRILLEVILTQQSRWEKVQESMVHLENFDMLSLEKILRAEQWRLASAIVPSGFYNQKAKRIIQLCKNIANDFGDFESFTAGADRAWLLRQSGIGMESADSILCYLCKKEVMVVDSYTTRLLEAHGYTFESYEAIQEWLVEGILAHEAALFARYPEYRDLNHVFALFHGMIVEYCKKHCKRNGIELLYQGE